MAVGETLDPLEVWEVLSDAPCWVPLWVPVPVSVPLPPAPPGLPLTVPFWMLAGLTLGVSSACGGGTYAKKLMPAAVHVMPFSPVYAIVTL
jgi:hypothetical protein